MNLLQETKVKLNKYYYYAKENKRFKCIKVGKELSWFTDYKGFRYQFYNEDIYENSYKIIKN